MRPYIALCLIAIVCCASGVGLATSTPPPGVTPCSAPEFKKVEESLPACGGTDGVMKLSGKVRVTDRAPAELKQVLLLRKIKALGTPLVAAVADNPNAAEITFDYAEPSVTYKPPVDLVIVPRCGPIVSIPIDRPGRCP